MQRPYLNLQGLQSGRNQTEWVDGMARNTELFGYLWTHLH